MLRERATAAPRRDPARRAALPLVRDLMRCLARSTARRARFPAQAPASRATPRAIRDTLAGLANDPDWDRLLDGVRRGEPAALRAFYDRYRPAIERLAARAIAPAMLRRFGPETVAHSVCRTFLRRVGNDELEVRDADSLWHLLAAIALNKVRESARFHGRERRRVGRESGADALGGTLAREPGPDDVAAFRDELDRALGTLDPEERRIVDLRLAGRTQAEIATELACSERTVRRLSDRVEVRLRTALGR